MRLNTSRLMVTGTPGLLAEPVGDEAFGALGIEQAETDPDKEQQEGKGVEHAQPGIHQCFPPVSVVWSGIRVVIPQTEDCPIRSDLIAASICSIGLVGPAGQPGGPSGVYQTISAICLLVKHSDPAGPLSADRGFDTGCQFVHSGSALSSAPADELAGPAPLIGGS